MHRDVLTVFLIEAGVSSSSIIEPRVVSTNSRMNMSNTEKDKLMQNNVWVNYVFCVFTQQVSCSCLGDTYHPYGGFVVGVVGGLAYVAWSSLMQLCHVDDPTDVIAGTTYKFINKVTLDSENKNTYERY